MKQNELIKCACGCGRELERYDKRGRERQFLPSHGSHFKTRQWIELPCEFCGKPVKRPQWHLRKIKHVFCNQACAGAWAEQHGTKRGKQNGHYNTITVACAGCGQSVSKAKSLVERRNKRVYCSDCVGLVRRGRKGFYIGYPAEFNASLRRRIRQRDQQTCQICGKHQSEAGTLHVHHIDYNKQHNDEGNLIALCRKYHGLTNFGPEFWKAELNALMHQRFPSSP